MRPCPVGVIGRDGFFAAMGNHARSSITSATPAGSKEVNSRFEKLRRWGIGREPQLRRIIPAFGVLPGVALAGAN